MKHRKIFSSHVVDFFFALSLFCVFTAAAFLVVVIGADVYQSTAAHLEDTYSTRTSLAYVVEKIRQHDSYGSISLTTLDGETALLLLDTANGTVYETYIYSDGSHILELTVSQGTKPSVSLGQPILDVSDFTFTEKTGGFLELSVKDTQGNTQTVLLHPRSSGDISQPQSP